MHCKICGAQMEDCFRAVILGRHAVAYFLCPNCGYLCTEHPYWLDEAYSDAVVASDTGVVSRNVEISRRLALILYYVLGDRGSANWLDYAGGYGILTRLMRDYGFNYYWSDRYCTNLVARGFERANGLTYQGVTMIEAIEHAEDPKQFLEEVLGQSGAKVVLFTTKIYAGPKVPPRDWWYYGFNTGQHISFFQKRTLLRLAESLGMRYYHSGDIHIFSREALPESRLRWVTSKTARLAEPLIRRSLSSKQHSDHEMLVRRADLGSGSDTKIETM